MKIGIYVVGMGGIVGAQAQALADYLRTQGAVVTVNDPHEDDAKNWQGKFDRAEVEITVNHIPWGG